MKWTSDVPQRKVRHWFNMFQQQSCLGSRVSMASVKYAYGSIGV